MQVNTPKEQGVTQQKNLQFPFYFSFFLMIPSGYHRNKMKKKEGMQF